MSKSFSPNQYAINAGWDYTNIEATAEQGVSEEDERIIRELYPETAEDEIQALLDFCTRSVNT